MKAVLRNAAGEHIGHLSPDEQARYSFLADQGSVIRSQKMKKGRMVVIFRLKVIEAPVKPSNSENSDVMLTNADSEGLAGCGDAPPTREQIERWIGWGLLPQSAARAAGTVAL